MIAATAALVIAAKAPKWAAEWAERLRIQNDVAAEKRRLEMYVFTNLMARRASLAHPDAIAALNLIDVVFVDASDVRTAYRSFMEAANAQPFQSVVIIERYHILIEKIARNVGLGDKITAFDIRAGYYPEVLGKLDQAALADAEEKIAKRQQFISSGEV